MTLFHLSNLNESWSQLVGDREYSRFGTSIDVRIWFMQEHLLRKFTKKLAHCVTLLFFLQGIDINSNGSHQLVVGAPRWRDNDDLHLGGGMLFETLTLE